ncbi:MAG: YmdB family metallophosphoesterase [Deltaproteobacteria bacterium]|nr:YmdB family metallophosphoesterase [Deltaproteobacteria bacterium]
MNILCVADIFGRPGRQAAKAWLPGLIREHAVEFTIVNWENAAGGRGVTPEVADELFELPAEVFTSGNHIWQHQSLGPYLDRPRVLRPHNAPVGRPGRGFGIYRTRSGIPVGVMNLQGRTFMYEEKLLANPFPLAKAKVEEMRATTPIILLDFHAEVTSEKRAMGWWLDGLASAVVGTHTHIQTADEEILPGGTAYITDLGMTGPHASVLGMRAQDAIKRFLTNGAERRWKPAEDGVRLEGLLITVDNSTGRAQAVRRIKHSASNV